LGLVNKVPNVYRLDIFNLTPFEIKPLKMKKPPSDSGAVCARLCTIQNKTAQNGCRLLFLPTKAYADTPRRKKAKKKHPQGVLFWSAPDFVPFKIKPLKMDADCFFFRRRRMPIRRGVGLRQPLHRLK